MEIYTGLNRMDILVTMILLYNGIAVVYREYCEEGNELSTTPHYLYKYKTERENSEYTYSYSTYNAEVEYIIDNAN